VFDPALLEPFLKLMRQRGLSGRLRLYASVAVLRSTAMADRVRSLPGAILPDAAHRQVSAGGGRELALQLARDLADLPEEDALHLMPLGDELTAGRAAAMFRLARGEPAARSSAFR
jgi:hypothetical protein